MLDVFAPPARLAVVRAGITAAGFGQPRLNDRFLLLALAEGEPLARPVELGVTAASVRAAIEARAPRRRDRELLATSASILTRCAGGPAPPPARMTPRGGGCAALRSARCASP
jgi:hypothetical protein